MVATAPAKVKPASRPRVVQKRTKTFTRFHGDRYFRLVRSSWRSPKGIDNPMRRRFRGAAPMPTVGYGTNAIHRNIHPDGFRQFRVFNVKELDALMMQNRRYAAVIGHQVSARKRKDIISRADALGIKVVNRDGRLRANEAE
jgi:large subunit ribosomal protein L32e